MLLAARLREEFNINGLSVEKTLLCRDKAIMKQALSHVVNVPEFIQIVHAADAYRAAEHFGFPFILKPTNAAGALHVNIIRHLQHLHQVLRDVNITRDNSFAMIAEEFISDNMFYINGFVLKNSEMALWPSALQNTCLDLANGTYAYMDYIIPQSHWAFESIMDYAKQIIRALQLEYCTVHIEVFARQHDGRVLLCEIAARTGGLLVSESWESAFNINLHHISFLLQAGQYEKVIPFFEKWQCNKNPHRFSGSIAIARKSGIVTHIPQKPDIIDVHIARCVQKGIEYEHDRTITSTGLLALINGDSSTILIEKAQMLEEWYKTIEWL